MKNGDALLSTDNLDYYEFRMEDPVNLDNRMQYVVSFRPRVSLMYALFIGKLYIDYERLSFTRAEFGLDMANRVKAVEAILHKKPVAYGSARRNHLSGDLQAAGGQDLPELYTECHPL